MDDKMILLMKGHIRGSIWCKS